MADQTHNGYANYATWGVALVLDNEPETQAHARELVARNAGLTAAAADALKDYVEELCELDRDDLSLMARQVLQAGLAEVDWREIAQGIAAE